MAPTDTTGTLSSSASPNTTPPDVPAIVQNLNSRLTSLEGVVAALPSIPAGVLEGLAGSVGDRIAALENWAQNLGISPEQKYVPPATATVTPVANAVP